LPNNGVYIMKTPHTQPFLARFTPLYFLLALFIGLDALAAEPLELRLTFAGSNDQTTVRVRSPELDIEAAPQPFADPLAAESLLLEDLRWYMEDYTAWPVGPYRKRAQRVEDGLIDIGGRLFQAVFTDPKAMSIWQQFRDAFHAPKHLTIDTADSKILRLPWELLAHGNDHLFALDISIRRRVHESTQRLGASFKLPLRILMVTARTRDLSFIDPRLSPRALLDAVAGLTPEEAKDIQVEFLPNPTFSALSQRLRDRHLPPVHVVHFDGHGVYKPDRDLGFLAFEDAKGYLDEVDAKRLGTLMTKAKTPLLLLDACQSASIDHHDPFRSVAPRLIEHGVGAVVAMPYSVLVTTSERFFRGFYRALLSGNTIGQAVDLGRWALHDNPDRSEIYYPPEQDMVAVTLRDWFLPVLYQRARDLAPFAGADGAQRPVDTGKRDCHFMEPHVARALLGNFPQPKYCFIGRARELSKLQRQLAERRVVVLHGLAGQGKTATASEAARWLLRTGRFAKAVFVSFEGGGDRDRALGQLGTALIGEEFASLGRAARLAELQKALAREPVLVIWDNFESVLPGWEAALPPAALAELLESGLQLVSGPGQRAGSRLLITSRDAKLPTHHAGYVSSAQVAYLALEGMATYEALELAGSVLDARNLPRPSREGLEDLLGFLGGHPLAILLVVPHLAEYDNDVSRVMARFEQLYPGFTEGKAKKRNESLQVSMGFSLGRLSEAARRQLPALGAFAQGATEFGLLNVSDLSAEDWSQQGKLLLSELEQAGLLSVKTIPISMGALLFIAGQEPPKEAFADRTLNIPFYRFHPTLAPHVRGRWSEAERQRYRERHQRFYYALANRLYHLDSREPHSARALSDGKMPNLRQAVDSMLVAKAPDAVGFATQVEKFLNHFGRWREQDALLAAVRKQFGEEKEGPLTQAAFMAISGQGERLLDRGQARQAESLFRDLLT